MFGIFKRKEKVYIEKAEYKARVMTLYYSDGSKEEFIGSGTCWNKMPLMHIAKNERQLYRIYTYIKHYGNPYPFAHENKSDQK